MIKTYFFQLFYTIHIKNKSGSRNLWKLQRLTEISQETEEKRMKAGKNQTEQEKYRTGTYSCPVKVPGLVKM
jgi:uncharacterized membrane protein YjjP (DUF1212 family)